MSRISPPSTRLRPPADAVVQALRNASQAGQPALLATVVRTLGSAYLGVGARTVIGADGTVVGMVSGGCLEADLACRAMDLIAAGTTDVALYDARSPDDLVWGLGLGCEGLVEILLEPVMPDAAPALATFLEQSLAAEGGSVVATIYRSSVSAGPAVGARVAYEKGGSVRTFGDWGESRLLDEIVTELRGVAGQGEHTRGWSVTYEHDGVAVAFEFVQPTVHLVICGTGPDASSLAGAALGLGWRCTVVAHHSADARTEVRFPHARVVECTSDEVVPGVIAGGHRTAAVIMSHRYERDREYLRLLLDTGVGYVGVLGPRRRTERMFAELAIVLDREQTRAEDGRVFGPAGLDIGGEGPELIALAILAEVAAVMNGRGGGHLRDRSAPIHDTARLAAYRPSAAARSTS